MADTPALRAKRSRKHKAGDHSLCRSESCEAAGQPDRDDETPVTSRVTQTVTSHGRRGALLWAAMNEGRGLSPTHVVLLEEACRMADRLDQLDASLSGAAFLEVETSDSGVAEVVVDRGLVEARLQETAFKGVVAELRQALEAAGTNAGAPPAPTPLAGGDNVVSLRAAVLAKRTQAAG